MSSMLLVVTGRPPVALADLRDELIELLLAQPRAGEVGRRVTGPLRRARVSDERPQLFQEEPGQILDRLAPVHLLAVGPVHAQPPADDAPRYLQQVRAARFGAAVRPRLFVRE